jgi:excisionase family DNA binding protein
MHDLPVAAPPVDDTAIHHELPRVAELVASAPQQSEISTDDHQPHKHFPRVVSARITVDEIARRLDIGKRAVYVMLESGLMPGLRIGRNWLITRHAYQQWERTAGMTPITEVRKIKTCL